MDNSQNKKDISTLHGGLSDMQNAFVFGVGRHFFVLFKKTEKLSSALFLVTQFIPEGECLRRDLRDKGVAMISAIALSRTSSGLKNEREGMPDGTFERARVLILEILSLLSIAHTAGYVSEMNRQILTKEYSALLHLLRESGRLEEHKHADLTEDFFTVSDIDRDAEERYLKGHLKGHFENDEKDMSLRSDRNESQKEHRTGNTDAEILPSAPSRERKKHHSAGALVRHSKRRESILTILSEKPNLSVKDVARAVPHVSPKTLQRELLAMVEDGILKKRGERRWSTYSLA